MRSVTTVLILAHMQCATGAHAPHAAESRGRAVRDCGQRGRRGQVAGGHTRCGERPFGVAGDASWVRKVAQAGASWRKLGQHCGHAGTRCVPVMR